MRQPTRTTKCRNLPPILHPGQLTSPVNCYPPPTQPNWYTLPTNAQTITPYNFNLLNGPNSKPGPTHGLHSQSPLIRSSPMTTQSPRRGPHCRINTTRRTPPKTWRIWHYTNNPISKPIHKQPSLSFHHPCLMRGTNN